MIANQPLIFVIDDNAMLRTLIAKQLKSFISCEVVTFENADDVLSQWNAITPELVILDYEFESPNLEYQNGLKFLVALRAKSNVPVIALSGQTEKAVMTKIIKQGANDYIPKNEPQFLDALLRSVQTTLTFQETQQKLKTSINNTNLKFAIMAWIILVGLVAVVFLF